MLKRNHWQINKILISSLLPIISLLVWHYSALGHVLFSLDKSISLCLNESLHLGYFWRYFWAMMSLKPETYISLIIMILLNIWYVSTVPQKEKSRAIAKVLLMWLWLQIGLILIDSLFFDILMVKRSSPSLVLDPFLRLSEYFGDQHIKDHSIKSFPGGHGFAMPYFAIFSMKFVSRRISIVTWIVSIFFCMPRLMSGAHWATDIIFSVMLAYFFANVVTATPLYSIWANYILKFLDRAVYLYKKVTKI